MNNIKRVTEILNTKYPIIQAPMSWITNANLVSSVSNAGGFGVLGPNAGQSVPIKNHRQRIQKIKEEIQKVQQKTSKSFGLNIVLPDKDHISFVEQVIKMAIKENVKYFVTVGKYNADIFNLIKENNGIIIHRPLTPTIKNMKSAEQSGADILVVTGFDEGGILPTRAMGTFTILSEIRQAINIPLLVGGGINTKQDVKSVFTLGADGVYIGTKFIVSNEAPADNKIKKMIINSTSDDLVFASPRQRSIKTSTANKLNEMLNDKNNRLDLDKKISDLGGLRPAMLNGDIDKGIVSVNTGINSIKESKSVKDIINELKNGIIENDY